MGGLVSQLGVVCAILYPAVSPRRVPYVVHEVWEAVSAAPVYREGAREAAMGVFHIDGVEVTDLYFRT